jgi:hypothetical protein
MFDTAMDFLDRAGGDRLVSDAFKETIDFQRALTLIEARQQGAIAGQESLDRAQAALEQFLRAHPDHAMLTAAKIELAAVLLERARWKSSQASEASHAPDDKARLLTEARNLCLASQQGFTAVERELAAAASRFPKAVGREDPRQQEARDALRRQLLRIRLSLAAGLYDLAGTYAPRSVESQKFLTEAAGKYAAMYEKYQPRLAAYYARLGEARCYRALGDAQKALDALNDCLQQPDEPPDFRAMKTQAAALLREIRAAGSR